MVHVQVVSENFIIGRKTLNHQVFGKDEIIQDVLTYDFQVADKPYFVRLLGVCLCALNSSQGSVQNGEYFLL